MNVLYLVLIVFSSVATATDVVLRNTVKVKRFGLEKDFWRFHGKTIPIEDFVPHTLTMALIFVFSFSLSGMIYFSLGVFHVISAVFGLCTALLINFLIAHFIIPFYNRITEKTINELKPEEHAVCTERISGDGYGTVTVEKNGNKFSFHALSANETDIKIGTEVVVVDVNDGVYWVEPPDEVYISINEETTANERTEPPAQFHIKEDDNE